MPGSIKLRVELDTRQGELSLEEIERRVRRIGNAGAEVMAGYRQPWRRRKFARENFPEIFSPTYHEEMMAQTPGALARQINTRLGIGAGQNRPNRRAYEALWQSFYAKPLPQGTFGRWIQNDMRIGERYSPERKGYEEFWKKSVPPFINQKPPIDWKQLGLGAALSAFSPWLGARAMNQALGGRSLFGGFGGGIGGGGGGGGRGGLGGAIFGGGAVGFNEWYILIRTVQMLNAAMQHLMQTVQKGSELYRQAAATATGTRQLAHLQAALGGIGISPETVNRMIEQRQFGRGGRVTSYEGVLMRARMSGAGMGEIQQIINMRKELEFLFYATKFGSVYIGDAAKSMNRLNMRLHILQTDWEAFWATFVKTMEPWLHSILGMLDQMLRGATFLMAHAREAMLRVVFGAAAGKLIEKGLSKLYPSGSPGSQYVGGALTQRPESAWEKMGLIISGGIGGKDYARQTAENTKKIAEHIARAFPVSGTAYTSGNQPNFNLP